MTTTNPSVAVEQADPLCPVRQLLGRVGTKWMPLVMKLLAEAEPQEVRFAALRQQMPGVSAKMLSQTLQGMVRDGLASRRVEGSVPPSVHYRLTPLGASLEVPMAALRDWARQHMAELDQAGREWDRANEPAAEIPPIRNREAQVTGPHLA